MLPDKILILTGSPPLHGFGHFQRCINLKQELNLLGHKTRLRFFSNKKVSASSEKFIIIDSRDVDISEQKSKFLIFLDNRSESKPLNSISIDTLPHLDQTREQFLKAMSFFMGSAPFPNFKTRPLRSSLSLIKKAVRPSVKKKYEEFQKSLIRNKTKIHGYFGLTLLESLQAGKNFQCRILTPYHWQLSVHLKRELNYSRKALTLLDGKGIKRLAKAISSAVKLPE